MTYDEKATTLDTDSQFSAQFVRLRTVGSAVGGARNRLTVELLTCSAQFVPRMQVICKAHGFPVGAVCDHIGIGRSLIEGLPSEEGLYPTGAVDFYQGMRESEYRDLFRQTDRPVLKRDHLITDVVWFVEPIRTHAQARELDDDKPPFAAKDTHVATHLPPLREASVDLWCVGGSHALTVAKRDLIAYTARARARGKTSILRLPVA